MPMTGFFCQDEYLAKTAKLTDEEVGRLFRALMDYHANGTVTDLDGRESIAFDFIREDIDKSEEAYANKCRQASENRRKGLNHNITDDNGGQRPSTSVNGSDHNNINKININNNETDNDNLFDRFWAAYPRKVAKPDARKKFEKLNPDGHLLEVMLQAIERQKKSEQWTKDGGQFIPYPSTWIHQRRWEDETPIKKVTAHDYEQRDYQEVQDDFMKAQNERILKRLEVLA